jgi:hypothetical protein
MAKDSCKNHSYEDATHVVMVRTEQGRFVQRLCADCTDLVANSGIDATISELPRRDDAPLRGEAARAFSRRGGR